MMYRYVPCQMARCGTPRHAAARRGTPPQPRHAAARRGTPRHAVARRGTPCPRHTMEVNAPAATTCGSVCGVTNLLRAVSDRQADADEAITQLGITASSAGTSEALGRQCSAAIRVLDTIRDRVGAVGTRIDFGRYLYIYAIVQQYVATSVGDSITLGGP